jgi:T5SS/PEP-CTERM-associated repeat protein
VPGASDTAVFDLSGALLVPVVAQGVTVANLFNRGMSLDLHGSSLEVLNAAGFVVEGGGLLDLDNGMRLTTVDGVVSGGSGFPLATMNVTNVGTMWTIGATGDLQIGFTTKGKVQVDDNASLNAQRSIVVGAFNTSTSSGELDVFTGGHVQTPLCNIQFGSVHVNGVSPVAPSTLDADTVKLSVPSELPTTTTASLLIDGGGVVHATDFLLGELNRDSGVETVTISGVSSDGAHRSTVSSTGGFQVIGEPGTVEVTNGGQLSTLASNVPAMVGRLVNPGKIMVHHNASVSGTTIHSTWTHNGSVSFGSRFPSELVVEDGGSVQVSGAIGFGLLAGDLGHARVSGSGSTLVDTSSTVVGGFGYGELAISRGAQVQSTEAAVGLELTDPPLGGSGVVTIDGTNLLPGSQTEWHVTHDCSVGGDVAVGRVLLLSSGSFFAGASLRVDNVLTVGRLGVVSGSGTLTTGRVSNHGFVSPGLSPGTIVIEGDYEQASDGVLEMQAAGLSDGQFDVLHVTGSATLGGKIDVEFLNGYLPRAGDVIPFLTLDGAATGDFAQINFPQLVPGFKVKHGIVGGTYKLTALNDAVLVPTSVLNISTRLQVGTDDRVLIGGFILQGADPKKVMVRAIGPSLAAAGVPGTLSDPTLELHDSSGAIIATNNDWNVTQMGGIITADQAHDIVVSTLASADTRESAIIATLNPGAYTATIRGAADTTGVALAEVYDLSPAASARLANISTRGFVQTGDDVMIGGFIIGNQTVRAVVRAIGPSLASVGVPDAMADPTLELHDGQGNLILANDNWRDTQEAEIKATGLAPTDDHESAIVQTLGPGSYTAIVRGNGNTTGVGLVEAYNFQ